MLLGWIRRGEYTSPRPSPLPQLQRDLAAPPHKLPFSDVGAHALCPVDLPQPPVRVMAGGPCHGMRSDIDALDACKVLLMLCIRAYSRSLAQHSPLTTSNAHLHQQATAVATDSRTVHTTLHRFRHLGAPASAVEPCRKEVVLRGGVDALSSLERNFALGSHWAEVSHPAWYPTQRGIPPCINSQVPDRQYPFRAALGEACAVECWGLLC
jgi:hypothetical protein